MERLLDGPPSSFAVRVPGAVALAWFDEETGTIFVMRVYAAR